MDVECAASVDMGKNSPSCIVYVICMPKYWNWTTIIVKIDQINEDPWENEWHP